MEGNSILCFLLHYVNIVIENKYLLYNRFINRVTGGTVSEYNLAT